MYNAKESFLNSVFAVNDGQDVNFITRFPRGKQIRPSEGKDKDFENYGETGKRKLLKKAKVTAKDSPAFLRYLSFILTDYSSPEDFLAIEDSMTKSEVIDVLDKIDSMLQLDNNSNDVLDVLSKGRDFFQDVLQYMNEQLIAKLDLAMLANLTDYSSPEDFLVIEDSMTKSEVIDVLYKIDSMLQLDNNSNDALDVLSKGRDFFQDVLQYMNEPLIAKLDSATLAKLRGVKTEKTITKTSSLGDAISDLYSIGDIRKTLDAVSNQLASASFLEKPELQEIRLTLQGLLEGLDNSQEAKAASLKIKKATVSLEGSNVVVSPGSYQVINYTTTDLATYSGDIAVLEKDTVGEIVEVLSDVGLINVAIHDNSLIIEVTEHDISQGRKQAKGSAYNDFVSK